MIAVPVPAEGGRPASTRTTGVRPLVPADLDDVVELHRLGFGERAPRSDMRDFLGDIFFRHPWLDESMPSLAYTDAAGRLAGVLGVMPRPMSLHGRPIRAVVTHNFVVTPGQRDGLAAIKLMRSLIAAGPDLTLADGNETARKMSEALGGTTLLPRSERWFRVLRPAGLAVHLMDAWMEGWKVPSYVNRALAGLSAGPDAIARVLPGSPVHTRALGGPDDELDVELWLDLIDRHTRHLSLRPVYEERTLSWLLEMLRKTRQDQEIRARVVRAGGDAIGWYVYYSRPGRVGRVLQLGSAPASQRQVLDHLFSDAVAEGNVGLSGQSDPSWTRALAGSSCRTRPGRTWLLVYTADPGVTDALTGTDAFLSRMEGEAWLHFGF
jgi:hypothetical protein